jgi:hypothetical protein
LEIFSVNSIRNDTAFLMECQRWERLRSVGRRRKSLYFNAE